MYDDIHLLRISTKEHQVVKMLLTGPLGLQQHICVFAAYLKSIHTVTVLSTIVRQYPYQPIAIEPTVRNNDETSEKRRCKYK